jgi:hypothetical protein
MPERGDAVPGRWVSMECAVVGFRIEVAKHHGVCDKANLFLCAGDGVLDAVRSRDAAGTSLVMTAKVRTPMGDNHNEPRLVVQNEYAQQSATHSSALVKASDEPGFLEGNFGAIE